MRTLVIILFASIILSSSILLVNGIVGEAYGPFPNCGNEDTLEKCDKNSLKSGLGCCLVDIPSTQQKYCVLIGGYAQGWYTNQTQSVSFRNFTMPHFELNKTAEKALNYSIYLNNTYYDTPAATIKCARNQNLSLKIVSFLLVSLVAIFLF